MCAGIIDICFSAELRTPLTLVLEPNATEWQRIYRVASGLISSTAGSVTRVHFLGSSKAYRLSVPRDFMEQAPGWYQENIGRTSLVSPILETLQSKGYSGIVAIVCTMPPVDVDDWAGTGLWDRMLLIRIGEGHFGEAYREIDSAVGTERIIEQLASPPSEVSIRGAGFVPLRWQVEPTVRTEVVYGVGNFRLKLPTSAQRIDLHLKAIRGEKVPFLYIAREHGAVEIIAGKSELPLFGEPRWSDLPEGLRSFIEAGISKSEYQCPQCDHVHRYDTLICPEGDMVLQGMSLNTCLLFQINDGQYRYLALSEWYAYPLRDGQRIVTGEGIYEMAEGRWKHLGGINPFDEVDDGVWAVFHKF